VSKATPPSGAYCRSMALKLRFFADLRYLSDSERSDVERCDMPGTKSTTRRGVDRQRPTVKGVPSPQELLHVFGHDPRNVLEVVIQSVEGRRCICRPSITVESSGLGHERICFGVTARKVWRHGETYRNRQRRMVCVRSRLWGHKWWQILWTIHPSRKKPVSEDTTCR